jgi:hypothetical protein
VKLSVALASAKLHLSPMSCFLDAWSHLGGTQC